VSGLGFAHAITATALREAFDASFARAVGGAAAPVEHMLAVRIATDPYALRLGEIAGLHVDLDVVSLPSAVRELRGIASLRNGIVPVYDLAQLLGYAAGAPGRWLVLAGGRHKVGLAFDTFEAYLGVTSEQISASRSREGRRHVAGIVRDGDLARPIVQISSVLEAIAAAACAGKPKKEG
jgi:purine-binding chemotaxis protein CheW